MDVNGQLDAPSTLHPTKNPCTYYTGSWMGPRGGMKDLWKIKISCRCQNSNSGASSQQPGHCIDWTRHNEVPRLCNGPTV